MPRRSGTLLDPLALTLGVRSSRVHYNSADHFVTAANPDDSGSAHVLQHQPHCRRRLACRGQPQCLLQLRSGLRDADLRRARLQAGRTGAQLRSRSGDLDRLRARAEVAAGAEPADQSGDLHREDQAGNRGEHRDGRAHDLCQRGPDAAPGVEAEWDADLGYGVTAHANYTWLLARIRRCLHVGHAAGRGARRRATARRAAAAGVTAC